MEKLKFQNGADKLICPVCQEDNQTSKVTEQGSSTTCLYCEPFYDEEGNYHNHDRNTTTTVFKCSNGHTFVRKGHAGCNVKDCTFKETYQITKLDNNE